MPVKIKVAIADDHEIFRNGLQNILSRIENVQLVGSSVNGAELLELVQNTDIDIVLMDIKMPEIDGVEATRKVLAIKPEVKIIALTMFGDEDYLQEMIKAGAKGFLLKNITGKTLNYALEIVFSGGNYYSEELLVFFTRKYIQESQPEKDDVRITRREAEILRLVSEGLSNQEIADKLFISKRTVDGHKNSLIVKTGSKNIVDLFLKNLEAKKLRIF